MITILRMMAVASLLTAISMQAQADVLIMPGEVIKGHEKEEKNCDKCHKKFDKAAQSDLCADCHKDIGKDLTEKKGYHGRQNPVKECKECHTDHKGRAAKIAEFDHTKFDHNQTNYPLRGGHLKPKVKCSDCHKAGKKYREAPSACIACHKKDDKHKGGLGTECAKCHVDKDWKSITFDHDKTKFKLLGKHADVKCAKCHINNKFKDAPVLCNACHKKDDKHKGKLGPKCESCHIEKNWKEIRFDHDKTKYPLLGKHKEVKCEKCHINNKFKEKLPTTCIACHKKDDKHKGQEGDKCESCHNESAWTKTTFDHNKMSTFPLLGRHLLLECKKCHATATYKDAKSDCWSCHEKDDVHKRKLGTECRICHNARDWKSWDFDHNKTNFSLDGAHKKIAGNCYACHMKPMDKKVLVANACGSCHDKDDVHNGTYGDRCERCHEGNDWKKIKVGVSTTIKK